MKNSIAHLILGSVRVLGRGADQRRRKHSLLLRAALAVPLGTIAVFGFAAFSGKSSANYVAHEWGTFTSVQGGDGALLEWRPLESSRLPGFVYDWSKPGCGRRPTGQLALTKVELLTLQRMETPVIYFYAEQPERIDVSVKFPKGLITEWYPQVSRIGPSTSKPSPLVGTLDKYAHQAGITRSFRFASLFDTSATAASGAQWTDVQILPPSREKSIALPFDASGSHYFAARKTDANLLGMPGESTTKVPAQHEKFIFYRGVGNFETPLRVTVGDDGAIVMANMGNEPLTDLFLLSLQDRRGTFVVVDRLLPGQQRTFPMKRDSSLPVGTVSQELGEEMGRSLVRHGLYSREATAMVDTWKDSWFEEDGVRVLYILPRPWTDKTLPLKLEPEPRELKRVMVGRAEVLLPSLERKLAAELARANSGDPQAREQFISNLKRLDRFAEPALRLATESATPEIREKGREMFHLATTSRPDPNP